jgi:hypothetical protein
MDHCSPKSLCWRTQVLVQKRRGDWPLCTKQMQRKRVVLIVTMS